MKSNNEIEGMVTLLKLQRKGIPEISGFGDNNHKNIDKTVRILERSIGADESEVENRLETLTDADEYDETAVAAYDWVLENSDEPLVDPDDHWVKKALESLKGAI